MWKWFVGIAVVLIVASLVVTGKYESACETQKRQNEKYGSAVHIPFVFTENDQPKNYAQECKEEAPWWEKLVAWPDGITALGLILTLAAIAAQASFMQEHAEHFEKLAGETAKSVGVSEDTAKKQLRAYFGTVAGKLYIYDDGTVEPRVTFVNCGQTPAYDLQVIESARFERRPFKTAPLPDQETLQSHPHVVGGGQPYYFTCRKIPYSQGKQQLLRDLSTPDYAFILNLWCTYRDIFKDSHPVNVQLIIGGGTALQRTIDANGEWFGLFTDFEGNTYD